MGNLVEGTTTRRCRRTCPGPRCAFTFLSCHFLLTVLNQTLESMYVMWHTTKDTQWRDKGWQIWSAIESKTRTESGYASVQSVENSRPYHMDSMPSYAQTRSHFGFFDAHTFLFYSYFLSETLKYAYLLAIEHDPWPTDKYVFNTEAHPLPVCTWKSWEKARYGIP